MSQNTPVRREIARLHVPWLQHEQFPATKQACSTSDGLVTSNKNTLIKVVQELKRGRAYMDKQLAQLDIQLLAITDYLDGSSTNMFPPQMVTYIQETSDVVTPVAAAGDGRRYWSTGNGNAVAGAFVEFTSSGLETMSALVEEDLNSDTPCTTTGLWMYLYAYSFFKTITPEDMKQALLLEDPNAFSGKTEYSDEVQVATATNLELKQLDDDSNFRNVQIMDDFLKERLTASLCALDPPSLIQEEKTLPSLQLDDEDKSMADIIIQEAGMNSTSYSYAKSWNPNGLSRALRKVELLEGSREELVKISSLSYKDDEVSQEIRLLQRQLCSCIKQVNDTKRKLRKIVDRTTPWLSHEKEEGGTVIKEYFTMLQTKKELARKKKLRDKKLQRRQALRFGGGDGIGKLLVTSSSNKVRCHGTINPL